MTVFMQTFRILDWSLFRAKVLVSTEILAKNKIYYLILTEKLQIFLKPGPARAKILLCSFPF
jgi:hypothetical protein